jgi:hypothetical protein
MRGVRRSGAPRKSGGRFRQARPLKRRASSKSRRARATSTTRSRKSLSGGRKPKARKYTRYDPVTGRKTSVTEDDPRYDEWPTRKPSKYQKEASKLYEKPGEYLAEKAVRAAHRRTGPARTAVSGGLAALAKSPVVQVAVGGAVSIAAGLAIITAADALAQALAKSGRLALGEKLNRLSTDFVDTQRTLMRAYGVSDWAHVPAEVRAAALTSYKRNLATASAQAQGSAYVARRVEGSYK